MVGAVPLRLTPGSHARAVAVQWMSYAPRRQPLKHPRMPPPSQLRTVSCGQQHARRRMSSLRGGSAILSSIATIPSLIMQILLLLI
jgi:hypothetical protein